MAHDSKNPTSDAEKLKKAVKLVKEGIISLQGASKLSGVSKYVICRHLESSTRKVKEKASVKIPERVLEVFNAEEEHQLLKDIKEYSSNQSCSLRTIQEIAYRFAKLKRKTYPSSWDEKRQADINWLQMFIERYRHHSILRNLPLHLKINSKEYTPVTLMLYFKAAMDECPSNLPPCNIWNIDEIILHNPPQILSSKQHVSSSHVTDYDESNNLTMIAAINAGGGNAPPMLIFPSVEFQHFLLDGAPPGTIGGMNLCGELNDDLFLEYFRHFLRYAKPTRDLPCILLLNNHKSHMCLPVQQLAKENYVILITFHSHNVYRLQPIDKGVFEFFKTYYNQAAKHLMSTPDYKGKQMTTCDIVTLVGIAYSKIFTPSIIIQGFRVTGFYPFPEDTSQDYNRFDNINHISSTSSQINDTCSCPIRKLSIMQSTSSASKPKKVEIEKAKKSGKVAKMVQFYQDDEDGSSDQNKMTKSKILARTLVKSKIKKVNNIEPRKNEYKLILHRNATKAKMSYLNSDYKMPSMSDSSSDDVFFSDDSDEFI